MSYAPPGNAFEELQAILANQGVREALAYLNRRTPHRFTGIFRFIENGQLENLYLFDREASDAQPWAPFPRTHSYCGLIHDAKEPFFVGNALSDPRVSDHPARESVISYCGVPILTESGDVFGTLCHFDYKPVRISELDLPFLKLAAEPIAATVAV